MAPQSIEDTDEMPCHPVRVSGPPRTRPDRLRLFDRLSRQGPACWLPRVQREGAAQRAHPGIGCNIEKTTSEAEVLEERPKVLIPRVTVERKATEIVEQDSGHDNIDNEHKRCLRPIKTPEDANRTEHS